MRFPYLGLRGLDGLEYADQDNPAALALLGLMRIPASERARIKAESLRRIQQRKYDRRDRELLLEFVEAYTPLTEQQQAAFLQLFSTAPYEAAMKMYQSQFDIVREEGRQEAREESRRAMQQTVMELLEDRFGALSQRSRSKLEGMTFEQLLAVNRRMPTVKTKTELGL